MSGVLGEVLGPLVARGVIARRPRVVGLEDRIDADRRAVRRMQLVRDRYGPGPVLLAIPGRNIALVLSSAHVARVLEASPEPFVVANREKRAALSHFQPHGVLISHGAERADRRRFNEAVLDSGRPVHRLATELLMKVREEALSITAATERSGSLTWDEFAAGWWRMVRRVVLGDGASEDHHLTDLLRALRKDANWAYLKPKRTGLRVRFLHRLEGHLSRAEPGSLAALVASEPATPGTDPSQQVPQWLFAFDAAGMATFRALALLDAHPGAPHDEHFLRACVLESVRLWPTTPAILRDTTGETRWESGTLPANSALLIFAPYFHRHPGRLPYADSFAPETWLDGGSPEDWPLIPFSAGPAECPGRNLVLFLASSLLAALLEQHRWRQTHARPLAADTPLPGTLSPFRLRFEPRGLALPTTTESRTAEGYAGKR
jgi:Cytochrome P450